MTPRSISSAARKRARRSRREIRYRAQFIQLCRACGEQFSAPQRSGGKPTTCSASCFDEMRRRRANNWAADNRDHVRSRLRGWRAANPERARDMSSRQAKKWAKDHPERAAVMRRLANVRRRVRMTNALVHDVTDAMVWEFNPAGIGCCNYCRSELAFEERSTWHVDHVMPLARGGQHEIGNLVVACVACNLNKATRTVSEWRAA